MRKMIWLLCLLYACSGNKQEKPLPIDKMKVVMWDMIKAGEWYNITATADTTARKRKEDLRLYSQVLAVHGITREMFYNSYRYYQAHPVAFKALADSIDAYSVREKEIENERISQPR